MGWKGCRKCHSHGESDQLFRDLKNKGCEEELNALALFHLTEATQQVSAMEKTDEKRNRITCPPSAMGRVLCLLELHYLRSSGQVWTSVCEQQFSCRIPVLSALCMGIWPSGCGQRGPLFPPSLPASGTGGSLPTRYSYSQMSPSLVLACPVLALA